MAITTSNSINVKPLRRDKKRALMKTPHNEKKGRGERYLLLTSSRNLLEWRPEAAGTSCAKFMNYDYVTIPS
jgi:hypothetical protein